MQDTKIFKAFIKKIIVKLKAFPLYIKIICGTFITICAAAVIILVLLNNRLNKLNRDFSNSTIPPSEEFFDDDISEETDILPTATAMASLPPLAVPATTAPTKAPLRTYAPSWPADIEPIHDSDVINILLIGEDKRPGETACRSDSMMLLTINKKSGGVKLTSFLRDTYVQIPGYSDNKFNSAYAFGGVKLLNKTFAKNFGIVIDGNIAVDFRDFTKIIDILDGVRITITSKEATYLNKKGYSVEAGVTDMDGRLALEYSRIRKIDSDFYRTARQRKVLTTLFKKFKKKSMLELYNLSDDILPLMTSDMSNSQLLSYLKYIISLDLDDLDTYRIPADGTYTNTYVRRMSVVKLNLSKNRELLKDFLYN